MLLKGSVKMEHNERKEESAVLSLTHAAIKYGAWLISLIIVLYFIARHVFPFIRDLF